MVKSFPIPFAGRSWNMNELSEAETACFRYNVDEADHRCAAGAAYGSIFREWGFCPINGQTGRDKVAILAAEKQKGR